MKLVRFGPLGKERPGVLDAAGVLRDAGALVQDWTGTALTTSVLSRVARTDLSQLPEAPAGVRLGCPISGPGKIVCVGLNYSEHADETGFDVPKEPLLFFKSPTALSGPYDPIVLPRTAHSTDWEVELGVVIGEVARDVQVEQAGSYVAGFAVANDVTDRGWQFDRGGQWSKGKSADTFCPLGPCLVTTDELPDSRDLGIWLKKNGELRQNTRTSGLVFSVNQIVSYLSEFMTLMPGDLILTGTPQGVAYNKPDPDYLKAGDVINCGIEGLGEQRCIVRRADGNNNSGE